MTPASAGPWITQGALVGSVRKWIFEDLIRAMLVPHRRENAEFGEARHAADQLDDACIFVRLEAVLGDQRQA